MKKSIFIACVAVAVMAVVGCEKSRPEYVKSSGEMLGTFMQVTALTDKSPNLIYERMMELDAEA